MIVTIFIVFVFMSNKDVEGNNDVSNQIRGCDSKFPETCKPKEKVNPYNRGCQVFTRCRRSDQL